MSRGVALLGSRGPLADVARCCACVSVWLRTRTIVSGAMFGLPVHVRFACCSVPWWQGRPAMALGKQCALCCVSVDSKWVRACVSNFRNLGSCLVESGIAETARRVVCACTLELDDDLRCSGTPTHVFWAVVQSVPRGFNISKLPNPPLV